MGWLFAVALGMQERSARAVGRALGPIAVGHGLAIGAVVLVAALLRSIMAAERLKLPVAATLVGWGVLRLFRRRHPRWAAMQVGFADLTLWSFLMASAHGAGFMVLPVLLGMSAGEHAGHAPPSSGALAAVGAVAVHTAGYLAVTAAVALVVYWKLGLAMLSKVWFNLDLVWAVALLATGGFTLLL